MSFEQQICDRETKLLLRELEKTYELEAGDIVEFGCYAGDTSILLAQNMQDHGLDDCWLWLYDSFEGLPEKTREDQSAAGWRFKGGELKVSEMTVAHKFKKYELPEPVIKKGWFQHLDPNYDLPNQIRFALLDGDFYESIKTSLRLVAPKLIPGATVLVHDYRNPALPGSAKAVDEFVAAHPEFKFRRAGTLAILQKPLE